MNTPEDQKPGTPNSENPNEPGQKKVKTNDPPKMSFWKKTGIITIIAVITALALLYFFRPDPDSKKEKAKTEQADSTGTQPGTQPGNGNTQPGNTQPGIQIILNYNQTFEWSSLDPSEKIRLKALEVLTSKFTTPITVNYKDIEMKINVTNYQGTGIDMVQLQYRENENLKTIFTKPGNILILN